MIQVIFFVDLTLNTHFHRIKRFWHFIVSNTEKGIQNIKKKKWLNKFQGKDWILLGKYLNV